MSESLLRRRRALIDGVINLESAIAAAAILLRLTEKLPEEYLDRLRALGLLDPVRTHFARLHEEPDYDQQYARDCILKALRNDVSLTALLGPGGSGKTWTLAYQILPAILTALAECGVETNI